MRSSAKQLILKTFKDVNRELEFNDPYKVLKGSLIAKYT